VCTALVLYTSNTEVRCPHCAASLLVTYTDPTYHHLSQIDPEIRGGRALGVLMKRLHPVGTRMCHICQQIYPATFECCPKLIDVAFKAYNTPQDFWQSSTALRIREFLQAHPIVVEHTAQIRLLDIEFDDSEDDLEFAETIRDCLRSADMAYVFEAIIDELR